MKRDDGLFRHPHLAQAKRDEHDKADNEHGEDVARLPAVGGVVGNVEGDEEQSEAATEEKDSEDCIVSTVFPPPVGPESNCQLLHP